MNERRSGASVTLSKDGPTDLTFQDLEHWVIWQFPKPRGDWLCGAVHPPEAEYGWLPAVIHPKRECLRIHAHSASPFDSPEEAARWMEATSEQNQKEGKKKESK